MSAHFYVPPGLSLYLNYTGLREKPLKKAFAKPDVQVSRTLVLVGQGYVQHARRNWRGDRCIRYRSHPIPKNHVLLDPIAFICEEGIALVSGKAVVSFEEGLHQQKGDLDEDVVKKGGSKRRYDNKDSELKLSAFVHSTDNGLEDDQSMK